MILQSLRGRERELAAIDETMSLAADEGAVLLVTGEPGIGKSALLAEARRRADAVGYRVLSAAGIESEQHLPFGGLQQIMTPLMDRLESLPSVQGQALATALGLFDGPRPDLFLIAEAALLLLAQERELRPVLVVADDVQWLDPQTHQIVTFLAHRSAAMRLVLIGAARTGHRGPFVNAAFPGLEVLGVDEETAEALLQAHARDLTPADRRRIREEARGNPLALLELPAAWSESHTGESHAPTLSARLERAFAGRISHLPAGTRDVLLVAATDSSSDLEEILAATAAFRAGPPNCEALAAATDAGLVLVGGGTLTFRHPLVRSGILQTETVVRRQAAHRALADVLVTDRYRRTWHRAQSIVGPDDRVADELEETVPESLGRGAVMSAVASLERSAHLTSSTSRRGRRLLQAAQHAFEVGRPDLVSRLTGEAADADLSDLDLVRRDWLTELLNDDVRADPGRVVALCSSVERAASAGDLDLALDLLILVSLRCWWADVGDAARKRVHVTLEALTTSSDDPRCLCALALAEPVLRGHEVTHRLKQTDLDCITDADSLRTLGMAAYGVGDSVLATDLLDRAEQLLRARGRLGLLPVVLALQFHIRLDLGDWTGSAAASEEVDRVAVETGQALFAFNNVLVESRALALRGDWKSALEMVVSAEDEASRLRLSDALCLSYQSRGVALLSAGRAEEAFTCMRRQFDPHDPGYHLRESFAGVALMAEAAVDAGHEAAGRTIVDGLESVASLSPAPMLHVNLLYARAVLAPAHKAEDLYVAALQHDLSRWPFILARLRLEYGRWLVRAERHREAEPQLRQALDVFSLMGAARWMHRATAALEQAGGPESSEEGHISRGSSEP